MAAGAICLGVRVFPDKMSGLCFDGQGESRKGFCFVLFVIIIIYFTVKCTRKGFKQKTEFQTDDSGCHLERELEEISSEEVNA